MTTSESAKTTDNSLTRDLLHAAYHYLSGWRGLVLLATTAVVIGAGFSWSWLVAAGFAPVLLSALPCLVMCGLGLCMNKLVGGSCASAPERSKTAGPAQSETPAIARTQTSSPVEAASPTQATEKGETHA